MSLGGGLVQGATAQQYMSKVVAGGVLIELLYPFRRSLSLLFLVALFTLWIPLTRCSERPFRARVLHLAVIDKPSLTLSRRGGSVRGRVAEFCGSHPILSIPFQFAAVISVPCMQ